VSALDLECVHFGSIMCMVNQNMEFSGGGLEVAAQRTLVIIDF
jgi:hypothetical protein